VSASNGHDDTVPVILLFICDPPNTKVAGTVYQPSLSTYPELKAGQYWLGTLGPKPKGGGRPLTLCRRLTPAEVERILGKHPNGDLNDLAYQRGLQLSC
jgi:hypothetical protein